MSEIQYYFILLIIHIHNSVFFFCADITTNRISQVLRILQMKTLAFWNAKYIGILPTFWGNFLLPFSG